MSGEDLETKDGFGKTSENYTQMLSITPLCSTSNSHPSHGKIKADKGGRFLKVLESADSFTLKSAYLSGRLLEIIKIVKSSFENQ